MTREAPRILALVEQCETQVASFDKALLNRVICRGKPVGVRVTITIAAHHRIPAFLESLSGNCAKRLPPDPIKLTE